MGNIFSHPTFIRLYTQNIKETGWDTLAQLACASRGARILSVSDEFYGKAENLLKSNDTLPSGWQVRRHLDRASVTIELGCRGTLIGLDINTLGFTAGASRQVSVEGLTRFEGEEKWCMLLDCVSLEPDAHNFFQLISDDNVYSRIRLTSTPGGGISRFCCYGQVYASFQELKGHYNLASANLGAQIVHWTDYEQGNRPNILLDNGTTVKEGWLTPRSREKDRNDFVVIQLAGTGILESIVLDTTGFVGNHPKYVKIEGCESEQIDPQEDAATQWFSLLDAAVCLSDGPVAYTIAANLPVSHLKLTLLPDGGLQQVQVLGRIHQAIQTELEDGELQDTLDQAIEKDIHNLLQSTLGSQRKTENKRTLFNKKPTRSTKRVRSK
ncbi:galactose-binding domain-like protein [Sporodiniella umbellata]|nr:galactose-binding domain-like protein [Sporodiniella umbellata]